MVARRYDGAVRTEHRTILCLLGLAVTGHLVRHYAAPPGDPPGQLAPLGTLAAEPVAGQRDSARLLARPLAPDERIDADRASAPELARLPRVGLALARRIVSDRQAHGAFGALAGLDRVSGIGPGLLRNLGPHLTFSGRPSAVPVSAPLAAQAAQVGPEGAAATVASVDLDHATAAELERLPGVGPALAGGIAAWREAHGPFPSVEALAQVPHLGPVRAARIWAAAHLLRP